MSSVTGAEQLIANIKAVAAKLTPEYIQSIMERGGFAGEAEAKGRSRYKTGAMRAATKWNQDSATKGTLGSDVNYAIYNELGTYKMSAQPFITPGAVLARDEMMALLSNALSFI